MIFFLANSSQERSRSSRKCFHVFFHEFVHCHVNMENENHVLRSPKKIRGLFGKKNAAK